MKKQYKISFLIPAHNEEKIIATTISHLLKIPYDNYEIILGLDGCTDKTEDIVKNFCNKSNKVRYYKLNLRQGKPAVIDSIIKKAGGEIIFINDADWMYGIKNKKIFEEFLSVFNDKKIGGIAESFPAEWHQNMLKKGDIGYKMEAYSSYFWLKYQKQRFTYKKGKLRYLKEPTMFLTNIFRKKLYKPNFSLGDDFERTSHIMKNRYQVVLFDNPDMPRIKTTYQEISEIAPLEKNNGRALRNTGDSERLTPSCFFKNGVAQKFKNAPFTKRMQKIVSFAYVRGV